MRETDPERGADVPDGAGCTEIWEQLSARRSTGTDPVTTADDDSVDKE